MGKQWKQWLALFRGLQNQCRWWFPPEIKRRLLLGRKVMTKLDSILKSRDITLSAKIHPVKAMVFPVVMYGCESWTIKRAEHRRIDAFELWCWRRLLRVPWTAAHCPSPITRAWSNSCPSHWWCHPTISSSVVPFFSCPQSFPASRSFQMSQFFASGGQRTGVSASASVLPMNIQDLFPSLFTLMHWRRKWQPTTVFFPGESQGRGSLVGCCLWGCFR